MISLNNKKGISPIISVVLLIVVSVALVGIFISWSRSTVDQGLEGAQQGLNVASDLECMRANLIIDSCEISASTNEVSLLITNNSNLDLQRLTLNIFGKSSLNSETLQIEGFFTESINSGEIKFYKTSQDFEYLKNDLNLPSKIIDVNNIDVFTLYSYTCPNKVINLEGCNIVYE